MATLTEMDIRRLMGSNSRYVGGASGGSVLIFGYGNGLVEVGAVAPQVASIGGRALDCDGPAMNPAPMLLNRMLQPPHSGCRRRRHLRCFEAMRTNMAEET